MSYPATAVANYLINKTNEEGDINFNPMKLLKLLYLAHGWNLAIFDRPLISEPIKAWPYGPVIPDIYYAIKHFGLGVVTETIEDRFKKNSKPLKFDQETEALLNKVFTVYKNKTGIQLSNWSHLEDGPWYSTWEDGAGLDHTIPDDKLKDYFKKLGNIQ